MENKKNIPNFLNQQENVPTQHCSSGNLQNHNLNTKKILQIQKKINILHLKKPKMLSGIRS